MLFPTSVPHTVENISSNAFKHPLKLMKLAMKD
jgi:hypothetical protein